MSINNQHYAILFVFFQLFLFSAPAMAPRPPPARLFDAVNNGDRECFPALGFSLFQMRQIVDGCCS